MNKAEFCNSIYKLWVFLNGVAVWCLEHQNEISIVINLLKLIRWLSGLGGV